MEEGSRREADITNDEAWPFLEYIGRIDIDGYEWTVHPLQESTKTGLKVVDGCTPNVVVRKERD